jgi:hypothetical protein
LKQLAWNEIESGVKEIRVARVRREKKCKWNKKEGKLAKIRKVFFRLESFFLLIITTIVGMLNIE